MHKSKIPKRKPQQKKPTPKELKEAFIVLVPNGVGYVQATIEHLGSKRSTIKFLSKKGGYDVVETSKIRLEKSARGFLKGVDCKNRNRPRTIYINRYSCYNSNLFLEK